MNIENAEVDMGKIEPLTIYDLETVYVPDGYDMKEIPEVSSKNIEKILGKLEELTKVVNELVERE